MADTVLPPVTISGLPQANQANLGDQLEANQLGTSRSITVGQMVKLAVDQIEVEIINNVPNVAVSVADIATLKTMVTRPNLVLTRGYYALNDGGGGPPWQWVAGSTAVVDDFMVVSPTGSPLGRYIRQIQAGDAVSPKWAGAGLAGSPNDVTSILQKVIDFGHAIDASGGTYPMLTCNIQPGKLCPGIFSDGTATFVPAPTATLDSITGVSNAYGFLVTKLTAFYFRRLRFICPVSTDPVIGPPASRPIWFSAADPTWGEDWEVSDCHIEGYGYGIIVAGGARNLQIKRNFITGTWADGIGAAGAMDSVYIDHNTLFDGGYAIGALQPGGAIRVGTGSNTLKSTHLSISYNHIARYGVNAGQSSIDCASGNINSADISHNICEDCGGSIEFKTGVAGAAYRNFNISHNLIKVLATTGITVFYSQLGVAPGKGGKFTIKGNKIYADPKALGAVGAGGLYVNGFDNVDIVDNTITDVNSGIRIDAFNVTGTAIDQASNYTIAGNVIDVTETVISRGGGILNNLFINDNPLLKGDVVGLSLSTGTTNNLVVRGNYIQSRTGSCMDLRDIQGGLITDNTIRGASVAMVFQGTVSNNVTVEKNRIRSSVDPNNVGAVNVILTNPGVGLTDGVRTFTVTNGTGTVPTIFRWQVTGGVCVGTYIAILQPGSYSVFPTVPTVTVDSGIVGGATFTLTASVASSAIQYVGSPTGMVFQKNVIDIPDANQTIIGTPFLAADNVKGTRTADPTGTLAATAGDIVYNGAQTPTGPEHWVCVTSGSTAGAVWQARGLASAFPMTSAELRAQISDETGTGLLVFQDGALGNPTTTTLRAADGTVALPAYTFANDTSAGMFRSTSTVRFAVGGKEALRLNVSGASNNYVSISSNNSPFISAIEGSGGAIPLSLQGAGGSGVDLYGGSPLARVLAALPPSGTNVNYIEVRSAATAVQPVVQAVGSDTDITLRIGGKGAGLVHFANAASQTFAIRIADGTVALPSVNFNGATTTGLYRETGNAVGIATNAKPALFISESGAAGTYIQISSNNTPMVIARGATDMTLQLSANGANGVDLMNGGGNAYLLRTTGSGTLVNYLVITSTAAGITGPQLSVAGADTDLDLRLAPKGAGMVRFATATSMPANGSVATVLGSLGPTGSRTTVQKWLAIKDSVGNPFYIPCF